MVVVAPLSKRLGLGLGLRALAPVGAFCSPKPKLLRYYGGTPKIKDYTAHAPMTCVLYRVTRDCVSNNNNNICVLARRHYIFNTLMNNIFNKYDTFHVQKVGPDRACAEFVIKMGGRVRLICEDDADFGDIDSFDASKLRWICDHSNLPEKSQGKAYVIEIDARGLDITNIGMGYFTNLKHAKALNLDRCDHIDKDGMECLLTGNPKLKDISAKNCKLLS